jgi:hypothetical protein
MEEFVLACQTFVLATSSPDERLLSYKTICGNVNINVDTFKEGNQFVIVVRDTVCSAYADIKSKFNTLRSHTYQQ